MFQAAPLPAGTDWQATGAHAYRVVGDTVFVRMVGELTCELTELYFAVGHAIVLRDGYALYVVDARRAGGMPPEVRRYQAEITRQIEVDRAATIIYGAGVIPRTLISLGVRASRLLTGRRHLLDFVRDEPEALRLVTERRRELRARFSPRSPG